MFIFYRFGTFLEGVSICRSLPRTYKGKHTHTHNFVDISVCFWQVFLCFRGPRCIIRLLKVLQKVFHRTQRLLQGECFSSTRLFFVRISSLFLLPAFHFFFIFPIPFTSPSTHHHRQTILSSMPPSRR